MRRLDKGPKPGEITRLQLFFWVTVHLTLLVVALLILTRIAG